MIIDTVPSARQIHAVSLRELTGRLLQWTLPFLTLDLDVILAVVVQNLQMLVEPQVLSLIATVHARLVLDVRIGAGLEQETDTLFLHVLFDRKMECCFALSVHVVNLGATNDELATAIVVLTLHIHDESITA